MRSPRNLYGKPRRRDLLRLAGASVVSAALPSTASAATLEQFNPFAPSSHYDAIREYLWDLDRARVMIDRLWRQWRDTGNHRYADWAFLYWYNYWRLLPLGDARINAGQIGVRMVEEVSRKVGDTAWNLFWRGAFIGIHTLSKGVLDAARFLPEFERLMLRSIELDPAMYYANAAMGLAKLYFKSPPFPMGLGNPEKGWTYIRHAEPYQRGRFALWYLFAAEGHIVSGRPDEGLHLLDELDAVQPPDIASRIILETTRIDAASLRSAVTGGTYNKYRWDPMFTPLELR